MHVVLVDNVDSFAFNLVQALRVLGARVTVVPNTTEAADLASLAPTHLVISPGPGRPAAAGSCIELVQAFADRCPVLGVCLGHQCIASAFGGRIGHAPALLHGKTSPVRHDGSALFAGLPTPFEAGRYHSLVVDDVPRGLSVTAQTDDGIVMGLQHREHPVFGVQFHPESVLTPDGDQLLANFLGLGARREAA